MIIALQESGGRPKQLSLTKLKALILKRVQAALQSDADKAAFAAATQKDAMVKKIMSETEKLCPEVRAILGIDERVAAEQAASASAESDSLAFALHKQIDSIFKNVICISKGSGPVLV